MSKQAAIPWEKWSFEEDCRPVMPLTNDNDETFPMGLAIDFSSTRPFVKGEQRLPPAPIIMILSTDGVLCPFHVINEIPNTNYGIVKPPEPLPLGGQRKTVVSKMDDRVSQATTGKLWTKFKGDLFCISPCMEITVSVIFTLDFSRNNQSGRTRIIGFFYLLCIMEMI